MDWPDVDEIEGISEHQREALRAATAGNIGCLSGGPGTGKTHTLSNLIKAAMKKCPSIGIAAPTGIAAVRITTELQAQKVFGVEAKTVHTLLEPDRNGHDGEGWGFRRNEWNPFDYDFLVFDEWSMTPTGLQASQLGACKRGTKILYVGDPFQLPPVGHGKPFADMIAAGLPHGELTEIWRFAGRIAHVCDDIKHGRRWQPSPVVDIDSRPPENFRHIERTRPQMQIETMRQCIERLAARGFNPVRDVQVICAVNEKSPLSRSTLNAILQGMLNPLGQKASKCPFRVGDKVICLRNQFIDEDWPAGAKKPAETEQFYVANGEIGTATKVDEKFIGVKFGNKAVRVYRSGWDEFSLAYAITGHKSQGSQWPVVIVMADDYPGANLVCGRSWWYTVLSRASRLCISIGRRATIDRHCANVDIDKRKTFLAEGIKEWMQRRSESLTCASSEL